MTTLKNILPLVLSGLLFTACGNGTNQEEGNADTTSSAIQLQAVTGSPDFPDAKISIGEVNAESQGEDSARVSFAFNVENYELKNQTPDADAKQCANSDKGQHIHFILDNQPYVALYEPKHDIVLPKNSEHYLLVFLSRSYHESIKEPGASAVYHFKVDENGKIMEMDAPTEPMVFYSRPKGDYIGADTKNLLFDFFVWNTVIAEGRHHVKAEIKGNGLDTTLDITTWQPYFLNNMPMGKCNIRLTLVDAEGNQVNSPESEVTREFTLSGGEPLITDPNL